MAVRVRAVPSVGVPVAPTTALRVPVLWDLAYSATAINVPVALLKMTL